MNRWARKYDQCLECGATETAHHAHGLCKNCYHRRNRHKWRSAWTEARRERRLRFYARHPGKLEEGIRRLKAWIKSHPDRVREANGLRKQRERLICPETKELTDNRAYLLESLGRCMKCGSDESLEIHHIVGRHDSKDHSLGNLQLLCHRCHRLGHGCVMPTTGAAV